jgi:outer membrane protein TolC
VVGALGGVALAAGPAHAQGRPGGAPGAGGSGRPALQGQLALSLQDALAMGIENNLDVEIVRHDPLIARERHTSAWGVYDPELFAEYDYASRETPVASSLQTTPVLIEREITGQGGLRGLLPKLGWSYEVGYSGSSLETTSAIQSLSPEYRTGLLAVASLPLLRDFLWGAPWVQVKLTGIGSDAALEEFRRQLMDIVRNIEDAYWGLSARNDELRVARKSLETAGELLEQTRAQYEVGVVSRVEVVEAEAGVSQREFDLILAENRYANSQDQLIDLVLGPYLQPDSALQIEPTDPPGEYQIFDVDVELATERAFAYRPELALARHNVDQREIELKFAENQRLPSLDLRGSWGLQGLAGRTNPAPPLFGQSHTHDPVTGQLIPGPVQPRQPIVNVPRSYWGADDAFFAGEQANQWSAGAVLSIPLGGVQGRADVSAARLELRKAITLTRREEQRIILEVRDRVRNIKSALEGIAAAESTRVSAEEQLRAERIRLEHGESTPFEVLQREEDLVEAESQKIAALFAYHSSVTGLDRAQGTLLRDRNIVVEDALTLR